MSARFVMRYGRVWGCRCVLLFAELEYDGEVWSLFHCTELVLVAISLAHGIAWYGCMHLSLVGGGAVAFMVHSYCSRRFYRGLFSLFSYHCGSSSTERIESK